MNRLRRLLVPLLKPFWIRRVRAQKEQAFLKRGDGACARLWSELLLRPRSVETYAWFQAKHNRLMKVAHNFTRRTGV
jgi:hypothetical protein